MSFFSIRDFSTGIAAKIRSVVVGGENLPVHVIQKSDGTEVDFATQATAAALLAKIIATPSTEAKQDDIIAALASLGTNASLTTIIAALASLDSTDFSTESTLAAVLAKLSADPATQATLADVLSALQSGVSVNSQAGTRVEGTVTAGGTAQNAFGATPANGFEIVNPHASETLYAREGAAAVVGDNGNSIPVGPKGSYVSPQGYKPTGDVSVNATTTGHAFIARRW